MTLFEIMYSEKFSITRIHSISSRTVYEWEDIRTYVAVMVQMIFQKNAPL